MPFAQLDELRDAIRGYDFPAVTYGFLRGTEQRHSSLREVEALVRQQLLSDNLDDVREGLSNVLYWGYGRMGRRDYKVATFRQKVTAEQLSRAQKLFRFLRGAALVDLKRLGLPEFSQMSFISKVRMFLDPAQFVTLDLKLASLRHEATETVLHKLRVYETYIPITKDNERVYQDFAALCIHGATRFPEVDDVRAVDVERGLFNLIDCGRRSDAARLLGKLGAAGVHT